MTRLDDALAVRQSALTILRARGVRKPVPKLGMCVGWTGDGLQLLFRSPYQNLARPSGQWVMECAVLGLKVQPNLPYGVDVSVEGIGKTANITWGDQEQFQIVTFKRGPWQEQLERIAAALPNELLQHGTAAQVGNK